jgi:hypothetical protein
MSPRRWSHKLLGELRKGESQNQKSAMAAIPLQNIGGLGESFVLGDSGFARPSGLPSLPYEPEKMVSFVARRAAQRRIPKPKKRYGCNPLTEYRWAAAFFVLGDRGFVVGFSG